MKDVVMVLRTKLLEALADPESGIRSARDLALRADVDPGNLSKFLKAKEGGYARISFTFAASLLQCIGGYVVFPGDPVGSAEANARIIEKLKRENEELKISVRTLQVTIRMMVAGKEPPPAGG